MFYKALSSLTRKMPDFQLVILELDKMVLFCIVCMKRLKWTRIHKTNFWLKKCEKSVTDVRKRKTKKGLFLVSDRVCFALSHFPCICFFNCQSCTCGQLSHNYIKHDLGNPRFSSTTIVIPLFSWTT